MNNFIKSEKGIIIFPVAVMIFLLLVFLFLFFIIISKSTLNMVLHEIRSELYLINRNAIFAIQKDLMGEDISWFYEDELEELIKEGIMNSWGLDTSLKNGRNLIKEAKIEEVDVLEEGELDFITKKLSEDLIVHTVIKIRVKPIIFENLLGDKCEFDFHHDIKIEKMIL